MAWRNVVRAALLVLAVSGAAACGERFEASGAGAEAPRNGTSIFLPRLEPPPQENHDDARLAGELAMEGGCLKAGGVTPVWPSDHRARREGGRVVVLDGSGRVVARTGDHVTGSGGEEHSLDGWRLDRRTRRWLEERCGAPYWIVGEVALGSPPAPEPTPTAGTARDGR